MAKPDIADKRDFLLVDAGWFDHARELAGRDEVFAALSGELRRRCDELMDPAGPKHLEPENLDSTWWKTRMGAKQLIVAVWDLATAAHLHQQTRYADLALRVLRVLVEHNMAENSGGTCYGRPYQTWMAQSLDAGHAAESLGVALDLLMPFMDADQTRRTAEYLARFIDALRRFQAESGDDACANLQNIPMIGRFGMGVLAAALERAGTGSADDALRVSRHACLRYLDGGGHEEGLLGEGPMYGFACLKHIAVTGTVLLRRGDDAVWASDAWDRIVEAYASQVIPCDGTINPMNDCYPVRLTSWLLAVAKYRRNPLARWLWETVVQPLGAGRWDAPVPWDHIHAPWWNALTPHALVSYDPEVAPCPPDACGVRQVRYFPVRGLLDQRTGWGEDDGFLTITCCPDVRWRSRQGGQHIQADRGHFSLFALGKRFLIDNGYGNETPSGSTEVIRFGATGEAHSVPEIDGAMQAKRTLASGFRDVRLDGWATVATMDFHECYDACSLARRAVIVVPDEGGTPLYVAIHDRVQMVDTAAHVFGLLFQVDPEAEARLLDRETVDLVGGHRGHGCRVITTSNRPGRFMVDRFLGHPRLRFQCQWHSLHALTLLIPWRRDEDAPVFERTEADHDPGFAARLRFRGMEDTLFLSAGGRLTVRGLDTDAPFGLIRDGRTQRIVIIEGTSLVRNGLPLFTAPHRTDYVGPTQ